MTQPLSTEALSPEELGDLFQAIDNEPTGKLSKLAEIAGLSLAEDYIGADLSGANLSKDNLSGADLSGADLSGADLSGANLSGANLSGADLSGADLSGADLRNTNIDEKTNLDSKWRLVWEIVNQGAERKDLSGANLSRLAIFNPTNYWRGGHVVLPLKEVPGRMRLSPEKLVLYDESGNRLPSQIDRVDLEDSSRDVLIFSLKQPIRPGPSDYSVPSAFVDLKLEEPASTYQCEPCLVEVLYGADGQVRGVRLANSRLMVWFNLIPDPENDRRNWYSGSATSVLLDHQEILDCFMSDWTIHDPEKRCMQVEQVELWNLSGEGSLDDSIKLFNRPYELMSQSVGPVRASITVASEPFTCNYPDPRINQPRQLTCRLYRVISLYADSEYLIEEVFVKGRLHGGTTDEEVINPFFALRYYAHINFRPQKDMVSEECIYDWTHGWSAVGSPREPYPGYGLATSVEQAVSPIRWGQHRFKWDLTFGQSIKCLHLFMHGPLGGHDAWTGIYWDRYINRPLKAKSCTEGQSEVLTPV